jgi:hypothetical protein
MIELGITHVVVGPAGSMAFILTGQCMHWFQNHLHGMPDGPRLFFRSAHVYLLWSSLLNILLGYYLFRPPSGMARYVQLVSSLAIGRVRGSRVR